MASAGLQRALLVIVLVCAPLLWMLLASVKNRAGSSHAASGLGARRSIGTTIRRRDAVPFMHYFANSLLLPSSAAASRLSTACSRLCAGLLAFPRKGLVFLFVWLR